MITSRIRRLLLPRTVANTGSQLRDHQANERTFLSWSRMGLAFTALGLALGRLGLIDHVFNTYRSSGLKDISGDAIKSAGSREGDAMKEPKFDAQFSNINDLRASQTCYVIGVWSFGYGIFRYISVRRNLMHGRFVPALWGPILMTCGSLGLLYAVLGLDCRRSISLFAHGNDVPVSKLNDSRNR